MRSKDFSYREVIHLIAYTDGSYRKVNGEYKCGWAYVLMDEQGKIVHQEYGSTNEYISTRNVVGELVAVVALVGFCELMGVEYLTIYHDYLGVGAWAEGTWKAKNEMTKRYKDFMKDTPIKIKFIHVDGHSGNKYNDMVDELAKKGCECNE